MMMLPCVLDLNAIETLANDGDMRVSMQRADGMFNLCDPSSHGFLRPLSQREALVLAARLVRAAQGLPQKVRG